MSRKSNLVHVFMRCMKFHVSGEILNWYCVVYIVNVVNLRCTWNTKRKYCTNIRRTFAEYMRFKKQII